MKVDKVLVVYDPTTNTQLALERAAVIAEREGMKLHVYSCIYAEFPSTGEESTGKDALVAAQQEILSSAVAAIAERGIELTTEVEWDHDWYQAVVRASERIGADAVIKASHKHSATQRLLQKTSDRTLLRQCECPVFLVKTEVNQGARKVLAAIDVRGENESYEELNETILDVCNRYTNAENIELHFVNAYEHLPDRPDKGSLIRACGVPGDHVHIEKGDPEEVIIDCAKKLGAHVLVIGNSARSGLSALVNTNTAEKVLDELDCDLVALP